MPIVNGQYQNPGWVDGQEPAIDAEELNAMSDTIVSNQDKYTKEQTVSQTTEELFGIDNAIPDEIFQSIGERTEAIGTVRITARNDLDSSWVICNGSVFDDTQYPELYNIVIPDVSNIFLQTRMTLPNRPNIGYYSYCNGHHIFPYGTGSGPSYIAIIDSINNPSFTQNPIRIGTANSYRKIIYIPKRNLYLASADFGQGAGGTSLLASSDLDSWTQISKMVFDSTHFTSSGVFCYSDFDDSLYALAENYNGSYYDMGLFKSTDFSTWEKLYTWTAQRTQQYNGKSIYAADGYVYFSGGTNYSTSYSYNVYGIYDTVQNKFAGGPWTLNGSNYVMFCGTGNIVVKCSGNLGGAYLSSPSITMNNIGKTNTFPISVNLPFNLQANKILLEEYNGNYILLNEYVGIVYIDSNGNVLDSNKNNPLNTTYGGFSVDGKNIYVGGTTNKSSGNAYVYYLSKQLPTVELTNATAYIKATQTPST